LKECYKISTVCRIYDISRQAYYKYLNHSIGEGISEAVVIEKVLSIRHMLPMVGGKKLYYMLRRDLEQIGKGIGRDKLFDILRRNNLLVRRRKRYVKTTDSTHRFRVYKNLIKELEINRRNQVFVGDITYIPLMDGFCYLSLLTDVYSRKIVGYCVSDNLTIEGSLRALRMALKGVADPDGMIHHTDRGFQYCSNVYTKLLNCRKIQISMAEKGNCYENALAERVNGILKTEFMLDVKFKDIKQAKRAVDEAIRNYNRIRPHMSIEMKTPDQKYVEAA
jgi:putative transposase